jgi:hypothetical protein
METIVTTRYVVGKRSQAIYPRCRGLVLTTYRHRDLPFSDGSVSARNRLVSVCDACDTVVAIPAQSTPAIRAANPRLPKPRTMHCTETPPFDQDSFIIIVQCHCA